MTPYFNSYQIILGYQIIRFNQRIDVWSIFSCWLWWQLLSTPPSPPPDSASALSAGSVGLKTSTLFPLLRHPLRDRFKLPFVYFFPLVSCPPKDNFFFRCKLDRCTFPFFPLLVFPSSDQVCYPVAGGFPSSEPPPLQS